MATLEKFGAPGVFEPATYSQGVKVSQAQTILFLSGQVAYTADGSAAHRGDFKAQARGAYDAIKVLVESQGGTMANIVKITTYVTDMMYRVDLAPIRAERQPNAEFTAALPNGVRHQAEHSERGQSEAADRKGGQHRCPSHRIRRAIRHFPRNDGFHQRKFRVERPERVADHAHGGRARRPHADQELHGGRGA